MQQNSKPISKKQHSEIIQTQKNTQINTDSDRAETRGHPERASLLANSNLNQESNSRILHNNWIIDNHQVISDSNGHRNSKNKLTANPGNKSVIIVKPNHISSSLDKNNESKMKDSSMFNSSTGVAQNSSNHASRSSLRKATGSQRKQQNNSSLNKENAATSKFFRNQAVDIISTKGRCSSAKPQRKDNVSAIALGLGLSKNGSLKGKGKWKF